MHRPSSPPSVIWNDGARAPLGLPSWFSDPTAVAPFARSARRFAHRLRTRLSGGIARSSGTAWRQRLPFPPASSGHSRPRRRSALRLCACGVYGHGWRAMYGCPSLGLTGSKPLCPSPFCAAPPHLCDRPGRHRIHGVRRIVKKQPHGNGLDRLRAGLRCPEKNARRNVSSLPSPNTRRTPDSGKPPGSNPSAKMAASKRPTRCERGRFQRSRRGFDADCSVMSCAASQGRNMAFIESIHAREVWPLQRSRSHCKPCRASFRPIRTAVVTGKK